MKLAKKKISKPSFDMKKSFTNMTASWNLALLTKFFVLFGLAILLISGWFWYTKLYMTNERRFWMALENSMSTPSVVRTLTEGGSGNQVVQKYRFHYAPQQVIENKVEFTQKSATVDTRVVTEGIVYPNDQYLRYVEFVNKSEGNFDENIDEVLGLWAHQANDDEEDARLNFLSEYVTLALFGNFPAQIRNDFIAEMKAKNVYTTDFESAVMNEVDGEQVLEYGVSVELRAFAELLNKSFEIAGYGDFPPLNPENYQEGSKLNAQFRIRTRDNVLVGVNFGGREEVYGNYGVIKDIETPEASLSIDELQSKVQDLLL